MENVANPGYGLYLSGKADIQGPICKPAHIKRFLLQSANRKYGLSAFRPVRNRTQINGYRCEGSILVGEVLDVMRELARSGMTMLPPPAPLPLNKGRGRGVIWGFAANKPKTRRCSSLVRTEISGAGSVRVRKQALQRAQQFLIRLQGRKLP